MRGNAPSLDGSFAVVDLCFVSTLRAVPRHFITSVLPTKHLFDLGRAGRLINRPVTVRTIPDFKHPRTGCTTLLLLSATTELFIINLIPQHDPQSDPSLRATATRAFPRPFVFQHHISGTGFAESGPTSKKPWWRFW